MGAAVGDAEERWAKHMELERQRVEAEIETDFERYMRGGEVTD